MAIDFEAGSSQFLELPRPTAIAQNRAAVSIVAWFRPETNVNANIIDVSTNNGGVPTSDTRTLLKSTTAPANGVEMSIRAPDAAGQVIAQTGGGELSNGTWAHIGGAADIANDTCDLYVNGALDSSPAVAYTNAATDNTSSASGAIAAEANSGANFQDGTIADLLYYGRKLSAAELATIHATRGAVVPWLDLVCRWQMKELGDGTAVAAGASVIDQVGTTNTNCTPGGGPVYAAGPVRFRPYGGD